MFKYPLLERRISESGMRATRRNSCIKNKTRIILFAIFFSLLTPTAHSLADNQGQIQQLKVIGISMVDFTRNIEKNIRQIDDAAELWMTYVLYQYANQAYLDIGGIIDMLKISEFITNKSKRYSAREIIVNRMKSMSDKLRREVQLISSTTPKMKNQQAIYASNQIKAKLIETKVALDNIKLE